MLFAHDTDVALTAMAALVNTGRGGEGLPDAEALDHFLTAHEFTGRRDGSQIELDAIHRLRDRLAAFWELDVDTAAEEVNAILLATGARPFLTRHDGWGWHMHMTSSDDPLADRLGAEAAMAISELIRADDFARLRTCAAADCDRVVIDLSRNRSRRFCVEGNCANRAHVAAYRRRRSRVENNAANDQEP